MLTPQEVSERAFPKAGFGGYNMAMVDEFLDTLTEDYTALYKENTALKGKMKVLAEKIEEYRATEDAMRRALMTAQAMADEIVSDAEKKREEILERTEQEAIDRVSSLRKEAASEQARLNAAKNAASAYLDKLRKMYQKELDYLSKLESVAGVEPAAQTPVQPQPQPQPQPQAPAPAQSVAPQPAPQPQPQPKPAPVDDPVAAAVAEIESNMNRMMAEESEAACAPAAPAAEKPFENPYTPYPSAPAAETPKGRREMEEDTLSFPPATVPHAQDDRESAPRTYRNQADRTKERGDNRRPYPRSRTNSGAANGSNATERPRSASQMGQASSAGRIDLNDLQFGKDFDLE